MVPTNEQRAHLHLHIFANTSHASQCGDCRWNFGSHQLHSRPVAGQIEKGTCGCKLCNNKAMIPLR